MLPEAGRSSRMIGQERPAEGEVRAFGKGYRLWSTDSPMSIQLHISFSRLATRSP